MTIGGEPPLTPLPEGPPTPPNGHPVPRSVVDDFLTTLGYDPAWVVAVQVDPSGIRVQTVAGELYPVMHEIRHPWAGPEPIPTPRR